jgi:proteic killer suppression protein
LAIRSFDNDSVRAFFESGHIGVRIHWRQIAPIVLRKLDMLDYAADLRDLRAPPGNRLEALKGKWIGFHSIRVNDQWRIVFRWTAYGPEGVDIVDYH